MIRYNDETKEIICPQGDTGLLVAHLTDDDDQPLAQPYVGTAIFAVCAAEASVRGYNVKGYLLIEIVDNTVPIYMPNELSRQFLPNKAGETYFYDIRITTAKITDLTDKGLEMVGTQALGIEAMLKYSDELHSLFAGRDGGLPKYKVPGVAINV